MTKTVTTIRVFLSSPGDVVEERDLTRQVADELNSDPLLPENVRFEIVGWDDPKTTVPLSATLTPQEAISRGLYRPSECDVVIVVMWSRMGTPLPDAYRKPNGAPYMSATEWEYEDAYTASPRPEIWVFRRTSSPRIALNDPDLDQKRQQYNLVQQFFARFQAPDGSLIGGINEYESPEEYLAKLRQYFRDLVIRRAEEIKRIQASATKRTHRKLERTTRNAVFVSYSHVDSSWLERLKVHLAPLIRDSGVEYWEDTKIRPGSDWRNEIRAAIDKARVAVLLLSADFLASEFILTNELPPLLAAAENEGAVILPLIVSPCRFLKTPELARFQSVNPPLEPLIALSRAESETFFVKLTEAVEEAIS